MERLLYPQHTAQPLFVFSERYIVSFDDEALRISFADPSYKDPLVRVFPARGPFVGIKALPVSFLRHLALRVPLPLQLSFTGERLGLVNAHTGYAAADLGQFQRSILRLQLNMNWSNESLCIVLRVEATPVDPGSAYASVTNQDQQPLLLDFELALPIASIPELFNMDERARVALEQIHSDPRP